MERVIGRRYVVHDMLAALRTVLDPDALDAALARGRSLDLSLVVSEVVKDAH